VGEPYPGLRPTWAEVDLAAVRHNARLLRKLAAPAALCAVVKADAYGHGIVAVARAALEGGAAWLAVALVEEGVELRDAGIGAPVLVLSEPTERAMATVVERGLTPTVYSAGGVAADRQAALEVQALCALPQHPACHGHRVVQLRRIAMFGRQAVLCRQDPHPPGVGQANAKRFMGVEVADDKAAAVKEQQQRRVGGNADRAIETAFQQSRGPGQLQPPQLRQFGEQAIMP